MNRFIAILVAAIAFFSAFACASDTAPPAKGLIETLKEHATKLDVAKLAAECAAESKETITEDQFIKFSIIELAQKCPKTSAKAVVDAGDERLGMWFYALVGFIILVVLLPFFYCCCCCSAKSADAADSPTV